MAGWFVGGMFLAPYVRAQECPTGVCAAPEGRTYWVDAHAGNDNNPGTEHQPWATISRSTRPGVLQPGDAVVIRAGTYREAILPSTGGASGRPIRFMAHPGERVVISGAIPLPGVWQLAGADWALPWPFPPLWTRRVHDGVPHDDDARRRDLIIVDGRVLQPVYRRADLRDSTFFLEGSPDTPTTLYVRLPAGSHPSTGIWETSRLPHLFRTSANEIGCLAGEALSYFHLSGLLFEHVANEAQQGAVCIGGEESVLERVTVRWTNGAGVLVSGEGHQLTGVEAYFNGMSGIRGERCDRCVVERSISRFNNWKGYAPFWESGGGKWLFTTRSVFREVDFSDNAGPGLWLDMYNTENIVENSRFHGNYGVNLFIEYQSNGNIIRNNVMTGARYARPSFFGYGLLIHASDQNLILHNTLMANEGGGIRIRADDRGDAAGNRYLNNLFVANLKFQGLTGRDLAFENHRSLALARSNQGDGNVFWGRRSATSEYQTFYLRLLNTSGDEVLRTSDLAVWQTQLQTDHSSWTLQPDAHHGLDTTDVIAGWRIGAASVLRGTAVPLSGSSSVGEDVDREPRTTAGADPGADQFVAAVLLAGDASGDGRLSAFDAALILRALETGQGVPDRYPPAYDRSGDGIVSRHDALLVLEAIAAAE